MREDLMAVLRRATAATRASNPIEATRLIQAALTATAAPEARAEGGRASGPAPRAARPRFDPDAEIVEPVVTASKRGDRLRRPLRDVLRTLRQGRGAFPGGQRPGPSVPPPAVPEGARFETRTFASTAGARGYRLYVPAETGLPLRGLVVMLHGCTRLPTTSLLARR